MKTWLVTFTRPDGTPAGSKRVQGLTIREALDAGEKLLEAEQTRPVPPAGRAKWELPALYEQRRREWQRDCGIVAACNESRRVAVESIRPWMA